MKKKMLAILASGIMITSMVGLANADTITATYTADNAVGGVYLINLATDAVQSGNLSSDWRSAATTTFSGLTANQEYALVFYAYNYVSDSNHAIASAQNNPGGGNPAAFIAQISGNIVGGTDLSSGNWSYSVADLPNSPANVTAADAIASMGSMSPGVATYGLNGVGPWGNLSTISSAAEWIWSSQTDLDHGNDGAVYMITEFTTSPAAVPEPATMLLFGTGLVGIGGLIRRKQA